MDLELQYPLPRQLRHWDASPGFLTTAQKQKQLKNQISKHVDTVSALKTWVNQTIEQFSPQKEKRSYDKKENMHIIHL